MTDTQELMKRIADAKEHALLYGGLNTAFWPYQRFAMTFGELFDALEAAQAENAQRKAEEYQLRHLLEIAVDGKDAALARLAELEKQEPVAIAVADVTNTGYLQVRVHADAIKFGDKLYASAGASPEPSALQAENANLITALAVCRGAFPVPYADSRLYDWYVGAMADPLAVPDYVKACVGASPVQPTKVPPYLQERLQDFTCEKVENAGGTPGYTIYKTNLGRSGPFSLYDGEALALWTNIGKALGPEYTGASPVQPSQCLQSVADALTIEQLNDKVERLMAVQPAQNHIEQYLEMVSTQPARVPWWMPIESAPKDGTRVLIKADCTVVAGWQNVFDDTFGWVVINDVWVPEHIATHWQPLPAAPSTKEQRNA